MNPEKGRRTMKKAFLFAPALILMVVLLFSLPEERKDQVTHFYENSLHSTNRGLAYWYSEEQGGLEKITGIPFSELPCAGCHVRSCDTCHKKEDNGKARYSVAAARSQEVCAQCHRMEKKNDVHFEAGLNCLDCHTAREIHGDGTLYNSMQDPGAMDVRCANCHNPQEPKCPGHEVHQDKVDCNACHVRDLPSCFNCHFETRLKEGKSVSLPLKNLLFLINHEGRVTLGNLHTFVYQNKTMITFAPSFPHGIMKEGRSCDACHATPILEQMKKGQLTLVRYENGELRNIEGLVPVLEEWAWNFAFLDYKDGEWVPLENPAAPLVHFSGYSTPLTRDQFGKLSLRRSLAEK